MQQSTHREATMNDTTPKAIISEMKADAQRGPLAKPLLIARAIAITAAIAGAIPTGVNLYHSWAHGIPYSEVSHRLSQYDLWVKNFECKIEYRALNTQGGTRVDVGSCPKNGDIAIKISTPNGRAAYEWIAFENLAKSTAASLLHMVVTPAYAEEPAKKSAAPAIQLAQAAGGGNGMQVVCQSLQSKAMIIRIVNEGGKCYRENFSPFVGKVEKREEVPCNTQCPTPGKA
jgi:hypothetical protein